MTWSLLVRLVIGISLGLAAGLLSRPRKGKSNAPTSVAPKTRTRNGDHTGPIYIGR